jgi:hypothetical protein
MLKKALLGVAAAAAIALVPTAASAHFHNFHHHHGHVFVGFYGAPYAYPADYGYDYGGCYVRKRWVWFHGGWALVRRPICY